MIEEEENQESEATGEPEAGAGAGAAGEPAAGEMSQAGQGNPAGNDEVVQADESNQPGEDVQAGESNQPGQSGESAAISPVAEDELTQALESTLDSLNQSIERMEDLVHRLESGEGDWEESVQLLAEANDLAMSSSQQLDRAVQDVMYSGEGEAGTDTRQEKLPLEHEEE